MVSSERRLSMGFGAFTLMEIQLGAFWWRMKLAWGKPTWRGESLRRR